MKKIFFMILLYFLTNSINAQITIIEMPWGKEHTVIVLDSILTISRDSLINYLKCKIKKIPEIKNFAVQGMYLKSYLYYNNKIVGTFIRNKEFDKKFSNISDRVLKKSLPFLKLKSNTIYILYIRIHVNIPYEINYKPKIEFIDFDKQKIISIN